MFLIRTYLVVLAAFMTIYWAPTIAQDESDELLSLSSNEAYCLMRYGPLLLASDDDPVKFSVDFCFVERSVFSESDVTALFQDRDQESERSRILRIPEGRIIFYSRPEKSDLSHDHIERALASERMPFPPYDGFVATDPCETEGCLEIDRTVLECFLGLFEGRDR